MPITLDEQGIKMVTDFTLLTEHSVEKVVEELEPLVKFNGEVDDDAIELFDPTFKFDFTGIGDLPAGLAVATDGGFTHEAFSTGVTLVTNVKTGETADNRNTFSASGECCPAANVHA